MKKIAAAAGLAVVLAGAPAFAGGMTPATPEDHVVVDTSSSNGGIIVPILALVMIAAALTN